MTASAPPRPTPRPSGVGGSFLLGVVLARTFSVLGRHGGPILLLAVLAHLPGLLHEWARLGREWHELDRIREIVRAGYPPFWRLFDRPALGGGWTVPAYLLPLLVQAVVAHAVYHAPRRGRAAWGPAFTHALRRSPAVVGTAMVMWFLAVLPLFALGIVGLMFGRGGPWFMGILGIAVPVMILSAYYSAVPSCVVESLSPTAAIVRSSRLTAGRRWRVTSLVLMAFSFRLAAWIVFAAWVTPHRGSLSSAQSRLLATTAVEVFLAAFTAVAAAVVYQDLRRTREGLGVGELLDVFD